MSALAKVVPIGTHVEVPKPKRRYTMASPSAEGS